MWKARRSTLSANRIAIFSKGSPESSGALFGEGIPAAAPSAGGGKSFADRTTGNRAVGRRLCPLSSRRRRQERSQGARDRRCIRDCEVRRCRKLSAAENGADLAAWLENFRARPFAARTSD